MSAHQYTSAADDQKPHLQLQAELARTRAALERETAARMRLEQAVIAAVEDEQRRLAQYLHNTICQKLAGTHLMTRVLVRKLKGISPEIAQELAEVDESLHSAVGDIHDLIQWTRPMTADASALVLMLAELARTAAQKIPCNFHCPEPVVLTDDLACEQLLKIAHQAVTEALYTSGATEILISLSLEESCIILTVQHSGIVDSIDSRAGQGSSHEILCRRADMIGARLTISSQAGQGTLIKCELPQAQ